MDGRQRFFNERTIFYLCFCLAVIASAGALGIAFVLKDYGASLYADLFIDLVGRRKFDSNGFVIGVNNPLDYRPRLCIGHVGAVCDVDRRGCVCGGVVGECGGVWRDDFFERLAAACVHGMDAAAAKRRAAVAVALPVFERAEFVLSEMVFIFWMMLALVTLTMYAKSERARAWAEGSEQARRSAGRHGGGCWRRAQPCA